MRTWRLDLDDVSLAVNEYGDPNAPVALLASGVGSTKEFAARCYAGLVESGWRLVTYDLRGHGDSTALADPAAHALPCHVRDLAALAGTTGARLVGGTSLGAHVAAAYGRAPDGLLLAIPGWLDPASATARANAAMADEIAATGVAAALDRIAADPAVPRWVVGELRAAWPRHDPASLVAALRAVATDDPPDRDDLHDLHDISAPVGVVGLTDDPGHPLAAAEAYAAAVPRAALRTLTLAAWGADRGTLGDAAYAAYVSASR